MVVPEYPHVVVQEGEAGLVFHWTHAGVAGHSWAGVKVRLVEPSLSLTCRRKGVERRARVQGAGCRAQAYGVDVGQNG